MRMSMMATEARQAPQVIARQLADNAVICEHIAERLRAIAPHMIMIIGRGSSDHAGVYAKYLFEIEMGIPVCAAAPSVSGVYGRDLQLEGTVTIVISQSGRSPDILNQTEAAKRGGAYTIALVNDETSPLAEMVDAVIPLKAGQEKAVAATKSYLATLSALLQLCTFWSQNNALSQSLAGLSSQLSATLTQAQQLSREKLENISSAVVLGRGLGYAVGREVALKLKEVLGLHAEAFSSAEFIHGPVTLVEKQLSIIELNVNDASKPVHDEIMQDIVRRGAKVQSLSCNGGDVHPRLQPLLLLQRFYLDIEAIAVAMRLDPDTPPGLNKVTKTV
ncbi:glucosamine-6-phosphate deaminase NagB-II [Alteromonas halophila]|uniref:Glutamine--fructose-6-phosphate aminotransferase n=1 Tax=Alteromonas halophila TaxID=516698 RepID=A0A918MX61_9ALTE|nr:SIS domain-containing protein [Alteromonas halophila]GGW81453.1 glutamine--fructose-6-phosphate aminotransferase [Alteromonas halophila]